jgi:hypothetical protein
MASLCNFPSLSFSISLPIPLPGLPVLPSFSFSVDFAFPSCPLD